MRRGGSVRGGRRISRDFLRAFPAIRGLLSLGIVGRGVVGFHPRSLPIYPLSAC